MKSIVLKKLELSNWKAQNTIVEFSKNGNTIVGDNGVGKSSLQKAWNWLLTGFSDANTNRHADLFDNKKELTPETPIASVKAVLLINDKEVTIERTAKSKFVRKRGSDEYIKADSDEYKTYIDLVEYSSREFDSWVSLNICDNNVLTFCLSGDFFLINALEDKKKVREFLRFVVGDVDDSELKGNYNELFELLRDKPIDIVEQYEKQLINKYNKRADELPTLIKRTQEEISSYNQMYDFNELKSKIIDNEKLIKEIDNALIGSSDSVKTFVDERNRAIYEKNLILDSINEKRKEYNSLILEKREQLKNEYEKAKLRNSNKEKKNFEMQVERDKKEETLENLKKTLSKYKTFYDIQKAELNKIKSLKFSDDKCPVCGSPLNEQMLEDAKNKFEVERKAKYEKIVADGKSTKMDIERIENEINSLTKELETPINFEELENIDVLKENIVEFDKSIIPFESLEEYNILIDKAERIVIPEIPNSKDNDELIEKKRNLQCELKELNQKYGIKQIKDNAEKTLSEYINEQKVIGSNIAQCEKVLIQIKKYNQEKSEIISNRVNGNLKYASIQMFSKQKDGQVVPDLIVKDKNGIPYSTTNGASRILMAVDIQRFFCEKMEIAMPIFIDEFSIINPKSLPELSCNQVIKLMYKECPLTVESV